jgi:hypothetical protein
VGKSIPNKKKLLSGTALSSLNIRLSLGTKQHVGDLVIKKKGKKTERLFLQSWPKGESNKDGRRRRGHGMERGEKEGEGEGSEYKRRGPFLFFFFFSFFLDWSSVPFFHAALPLTCVNIKTYTSTPG